MSNIPSWYDSDTREYRDDMWPFQKDSRLTRKLKGKQRLYLMVKATLAKLPDGWSLRWNASRRRTFRVNHTTKTITVPFPAQYSGLPALGSAVHLARRIKDALYHAAQYGQIPASNVKAWPFLWGSAFYTRTSYVLPVVGVNLNHRSLKQAGIQSAKEVLRFYQSPDAWRIPRKKAGSPQRWAAPHVNKHTIDAIAHRKVLMDYLKVNDPAYRLPAIAKARLQKIQPTTPTP